MLPLKKLVCVFICTLLIASMSIVVSSAENYKSHLLLTTPSLSAKSAVLLDASTKNIICQKDAHTKRAMASTTKIMTALVAAELCELDRIVSVNAGAVGVEGSSVYLYAGEKLTMYELLCAMLLESANDAAAAIAFEVGGSIDGFCDIMNNKAKELNLKNTHFTNPHGLYDEEHYTTAYELALIARELLEHEELRKIVSTKKMTIGTSDSTQRVLYNHNKMLSMYDGAIGVKTGFTKKSGRCLVSAAERDGLTLIAVTIDAPDDWSDHKKLLDIGFENLSSLPLCEKGNVATTLGVIGGKEESISLAYADTLSVTVPKYKASKIKYSIECYTRYLFAPISYGAVVGKAVFYLDGEIVATTELVSCAEIERRDKRTDFFEWLKNLFTK